MTKPIREGQTKFIEFLSTTRTLRNVLRFQFIKNMKDIDIDLTLEMLDALMILWEKDKLNQQEIADTVKLNKASLTSLVDNLEKRKLVHRLADPDDRRNKLIVLTPEGRAYEQKVKPLVDKMFKELLKDISIEQIESAKQLIDTVYAKLNTPETIN